MASKYSDLSPSDRDRLDNIFADLCSVTARIQRIRDNKEFIDEEFWDDISSLSDTTSEMRALLARLEV